MNNFILNLSSGISDKDNAPILLSVTGNDNFHLCVVKVLNAMNDEDLNAIFLNGAL